ITGGLFRVVFEYPLSLRHPFAQTLGFLGGILMLGAVKLARNARERLDPAGPRKPERLVQLQAARDVDRAASFEKHGERDRGFNRLTGTLANVGDHRMCGISHQRDAASRPVWQRGAIVDAPSEGLVERIDSIQ